MIVTYRDTGPVVLARRPQLAMASRKRAKKQPARAPASTQQQQPLAAASKLLAVAVAGPCEASATAWPPLHGLGGL